MIVGATAILSSWSTLFLSERNSRIQSAEAQKIREEDRQEVRNLRLEERRQSVRMRARTSAAHLVATALELRAATIGVEDVQGAVKRLGGSTTAEFEAKRLVFSSAWSALAMEVETDDVIEAASDFLKSCIAAFFASDGLGRNVISSPDDSKKMLEHFGDVNDKFGKVVFAARSAFEDV